MLAFSTFGYPPGERTARVHEAVRILDQRRVDFAYEGEMGADIALNRQLMAAYPFCRLKDTANVLVMPAFHSAAISTKMLQELGGATVLGPLIVGLDKPIQIVQLGATDAEIVNMAALAAFGVGGLNLAPRRSTANSMNLKQEGIDVMKITMIGSGYVGLVSGACFADFGHDVICVDTDAGKIERLQRGEIPIYEPGLDELVATNARRNRLSFTDRAGPGGARRGGGVHRRRHAVAARRRPRRSLLCFRRRQDHRRGAGRLHGRRQ